MAHFQRSKEARIFRIYTTATAGYARRLFMLCVFWANCVCRLPQTHAQHMYKSAAWMKYGKCHLTWQLDDNNNNNNSRSAGGSKGVGWDGDTKYLAKNVTQPASQLYCSHKKSERRHVTRSKQKRWMDNRLKLKKRKSGLKIECPWQRNKEHEKVWISTTRPEIRWIFRLCAGKIKLWMSIRSRLRTNFGLSPGLR